MSLFKLMDQPGVYTVDTPLTDEDILQKAADILLAKINHSNVIKSPEDTRRMFKCKIASLEYEVLAVIFLDNRHRIITYKELFRGTVDGASVYPREVVKEALSYNASAMIIAHNHPSGNAEPSQADERITMRLKEALGLMDIRLLDHLIVGCDDIVSLAERGVL